VDPSSIGLHQAACATDVESVELARDLYQADLDYRRPDLTQGFFNYAVDLSSIGATSGNKSVKLTQDLYQANLDRFSRGDSIATL
jgi:hypothetical protein